MTIPDEEAKRRREFDEDDNEAQDSVTFEGRRNLKMIKPNPTC